MYAGGKARAQPHVSGGEKGRDPVGERRRWAARPAELEKEQEQEAVWAEPTDTGEEACRIRKRFAREDQTRRE